MFSINDQIVFWGLAQYEIIPDFDAPAAIEDFEDFDVEELVDPDEEDPLRFLHDLQIDDTPLALQFLQDDDDNADDSHEPPTLQRKPSMLNSNAPQFICAS